MPAELQARRHDQSLILVMSNPDACNTLHADMYAAAIETLSTAERDDSVRTVVLTGANDCFCGGANPGELLERRSQPTSDRSDALENLYRWIEALRDCPKPVIAAVEGAAVGAGFSLALACDFIVAGASATFAMDYVRIGLTPDAVGAWFLQHALPRQLTSEMLLEGKPVTATRMHQFGIVNRLVADGTALDASLAWGETLAALSPSAIERNKALINAAATGTVESAFETGKRQYIESLQHRDALEGITASLQNRPARYRQI